MRAVTSPDKKIRLIVADDSALMRKALRLLIDSTDDIELIAAARDGEDAIIKARELKPDVICMDINMPRMDGITALQYITDEKICPVIMLSSLTTEGAVTTFECLELGAFDYVAKPDGTVSAELSIIADELLAKIRAAAHSNSIRRSFKQLQKNSYTQIAPQETKALSTAITQAVVIGISTGGPSTIMEVLPLLPQDLPAPVFLVQHMPPTFTSTFAQRLNNACQIKVVEAESGMIVEAGCCYLARGGMHLTLYKKGDGTVLIRTPRTPQTLFVPSVNITMESVLSIYGKNTIGVLMTGIGDDGAEQMVAIRQSGGYTIAESEESCIVFGMPREAIERGGACEVLPAWEIAEAIKRRLK